MHKNFKFYLILYFFSAASVSISIYQSLFVYDGFHWGLVFANAIDFIDGKLPYKEIFIHYGFVTTFIHALVVWLSNYKMISLMIFTSLIYSLTIIQFFFVTKKLFNIEIASIVIIFLYLIHPFPSYPWHNYILFFFFITFLNLRFMNQNLTNFISGIMLALCVLTSEVFFVLLLIILLVEFFLNINNKNKNLIIIAGTATIIFTFFLILISKDLFNEWLVHRKITSVILQEQNLIDVFLYFIKNYFKLSFANFFTEPYRIISLISIFFSFLMILSSIKKNKKKINDQLFLLINISSIFFYYTMLHQDNLFRFATGPIIGVISIFYYIEKIKEYNIKRNLIFILLLAACLSYPFEKINNGNKNYVRKNMREDYVLNNNFKLFKNHLWRKEVWANLTSYKTHLVKNRCKDYYFANLSLNGFYYIIARDLKFKTFQKIPWYIDNIYGNSLFNAFDKRFFIQLEKNLNKKNIILIAEENSKNVIKYNNKTYYMNDYIKISLPHDGQLKNLANLVLFFPHKCKL